jgi:RimJ/RimL family protein N-acetyltransferase
MSELRGQTVVIRPIELRDVEPIVAAREETPEVGTPAVGPIGEAAREQLRRQVQRRPTLEDGGFVSYVIEVDGAVVGDIQARAPKHGFPPGVCEIGISLFGAERGKGLGLEAVELFTRHLLDSGWPRVQASTSVDNVAMRRVLEKAGYTLEGVLHSFAPGEGGDREDYAMYARFQTGDAGDAE